MPREMIWIAGGLAVSVYLTFLFLVQPQLVFRVERSTVESSLRTVGWILLIVTFAVAVALGAFYSFWKYKLEFS